MKCYQSIHVLACSTTVNTAGIEQREMSSTDQTASEEERKWSWTERVFVLAQLITTMILKTRAPLACAYM